MAFHSKRVTYDNITFDSETEKNFYIKLQQMKKERKIKDFEIQVEYLLQDEYINFENKKIRSIEHKPDFKIIFNDNSWILVDTKGDPENDAKLKKKIFMKLYPNIPYYWIARTPKYLGNIWVRVDSGVDFRNKLKNRWRQLYGKKNNEGKWKRVCINDHTFTINEIKQNFEIENINGLFYQWKKTIRLKHK